MLLQELINSLAIKIAEKTSFNSTEIDSERLQRNNEDLKIQSNIVETVVDEYNTVIGG